jgi:intracellular septation protein A
MQMNRAPLNLDRVGAVASAICAVHCVLTGVALGLLSFLGVGFLGHSMVDKFFLGVAVVVGSTALLMGFRKHKKWQPAILFVVGLSLLLATNFLFAHDHAHHPDHFHLHTSDLLVHTMSAIGGICLVAFHVWNQKLQHACAHR